MLKKKRNKQESNIFPEYSHISPIEFEWDSQPQTVPRAIGTDQGSKLPAPCPTKASAETAVIRARFVYDHVRLTQGFGTDYRCYRLVIDLDSKYTISACKMWIDGFGTCGEPNRTRQKSSKGRPLSRQDVSQRAKTLRLVVQHGTTKMPSETTAKTYYAKIMDDMRQPREAD